MPKRSNVDIRNKTSRSKKTKKRLAIKKALFDARKNSSKGKKK